MALDPIQQAAIDVSTAIDTELLATKTLVDATAKSNDATIALKQAKTAVDKAQTTLQGVIQAKRNPPPSAPAPANAGPSIAPAADTKFNA